MKKLKLYIKNMDCAAEENLIKLKLADFKEINDLDFNLQDRTLSVLHSGDSSAIISALKEIQMVPQMLEENESDGISQGNSKSKKTSILITVLILNFAFFLIEGGAGIISFSMGLSADSLDMLADAIVYGLSLYAIYKAASAQVKITKIIGYSQVFLALLGISETIRRFFGYGEVPDYLSMIIVSIFAGAANSISLVLLSKTGSSESHIKAAAICTSTDVIFNFSVIAAGMLVLITGSKYPDLLAGIIIFGVVLNGSRRILALVK